MFIALTVKVTSVSETAPPGAFLTTARSALVPTGTGGVVKVLFPIAGSGVVEPTVTVLAIVPVAAGETFATMTIEAGMDGASAAIVQVTVPATFPHANGGPEVCVTETKVVPGGRTSLTVTFVAVDGPPFVTVMVKRMFCPAIALGGAVF